MSYFVVVPGALVPASIASHLLARAQLRSLEQRVSQAQVSSPLRFDRQGAAHLDWLWTRFGDGKSPPPTAPYALCSLSAESPQCRSETIIWQADPVHFAFARDRMLLTELGNEAAMTADESRVLATEASEIAQDFGANLHALDSRHWFLSFDPPWELQTVALDAALGRSVEPVLPAGPAAARWRKLLTEIQMRWHQHPITEQREAKGVRTINGLWLHGGAAWQPLQKRPFDTISADDPIVRGWGLASGVGNDALLPRASKPSGGGSALSYQTELFASNAHEDWDGWLERMAAFDAGIDAHIEHAFTHGFDAVNLILAGREEVRALELRRSDRLKFWRHHALGNLLSETEPA